MENLEQGERKCLLCGLSLSSLNLGDICFCHDVMPGSPADKKLQRLRRQLSRSKDLKKAI